MKEDVDRYMKAMHAVQSGVAYEQSTGSADGTPKHLRVGIASAHISQAALVGLLIKAGIIDLDQYEEANADQAEAEVAAYEERNGIKFL